MAQELLPNYGREGNYIQMLRFRFQLVVTKVSGKHKRNVTYGQRANVWRSGSAGDIEVKM